MSDAISSARAALHAALVPLLDAGRVGEYASDASKTPHIYIGSPRLSRRVIDRNDTLWTYATFPVVIDVDGTDRAQLEQLDGLTARVWDAVIGVLPRAQPINSNPGVVDVTGLGAQSTRRQTVEVEIPIGQLTLCPPTTEESP